MVAFSKKKKLTNIMIPELADENGKNGHTEAYIKIPPNDPNGKIVSLLEKLIKDENDPTLSTEDKQKLREISNCVSESCMKVSSVFFSLSLYNTIFELLVFHLIHVIINIFVLMILDFCW